MDAQGLRDRSGGGGGASLGEARVWPVPQAPILTRTALPRDRRRCRGGHPPPCLPSGRCCQGLRATELGQQPRQPPHPKHRATSWTGRCPAGPPGAFGLPPALSVGRTASSGRLPPAAWDSSRGTRTDCYVRDSPSFFRATHVVFKQTRAVLRCRLWGWGGAAQLGFRGGAGLEFAGVFPVPSPEGF